MIHRSVCFHLQLRPHPYYFNYLHNDGIPKNNIVNQNDNGLMNYGISETKK